MGVEPAQRGIDHGDERDLWLRRYGYVLRRYGERQIEGRPDEVVADVLAARG
jgi:very-short-patch-repair endonuclease